MEKVTPEELNARLYDYVVPDWEGEVDFYRELMSNSPLVKSHGVLEVACGTGRVTTRLAKDGIGITGLDLSPEMLEVARKKSIGMSNVDWVQGDMRTFEIGKKFGCVIMPGHSFMFMSTPDDQVKCLEQIRKHLVNDGMVVLHLDNQDISWHADLIGKREHAQGVGTILTHPLTGERFRETNEWSYEPSTQTATCEDRWEQLDESGKVIETWDREPMLFHCIFRFETEHLLRRVGFCIEAVYGDFFKHELVYKSLNMIWIAKNKEKNN